MNEKIDLENIRDILKLTFPNAEIKNNIDNLKIGDFKEWDSLGNFNLLLAIEDSYNVRFTPEEIIKINSIGQIHEYLKSNYE